MKDVGAMLAVLAVALAAIAGAVLAGRDSTIMSSPPEAVAESFVRDLVGRRFDLAMEYVDNSSGVSLTTVRLGGEALLVRAGGAVPNDVEGERSEIAGHMATADVRVAGAAATIPLSVALVRKPEGVWRVTDWHPE